MCGQVLGGVVYWVCGCEMWASVTRIIYRGVVKLTLGRESTNTQVRGFSNPLKRPYAIFTTCVAGHAKCGLGHARSFTNSKSETANLLLHNKFAKIKNGRVGVRVRRGAINSLWPIF